LFSFSIGDLYVTFYKKYDNVYFKCTDSESVGLADVVLKLTNTVTNEQFTSNKSNSEGSILFDNLPFGTYSVTVVSKPAGYDNPTSMPNITINTKNTPRIDYVFPDSP